jgi:hypothetical protein
MPAKDGVAPLDRLPDGAACKLAGECTSGICSADSVCVSREQFDKEAEDTFSVESDNILQPRGSPPKSFGRHLLEAFAVLAFTFISLGVLLATFIQTLGVFVFLGNFCLPALRPPSISVSLSGMKSRVAGILSSIFSVLPQERRETGYDC